MQFEQKKEFLENCKEQLEEINEMIIQLEEQVKPIAPARLAYLPETDLCINCA